MNSDIVPKVRVKHNAELTIKTYAGLNQAAIRDDFVSTVRIWYLVRMLDQDGRGVVSRDDLRQAMQHFGLTRAHLRSARGHENASTFFTFTDTKVEYRSLESVCVALGVEPGKPVRVPLRSIGKLETFKAHLYASWFNETVKHISRAKLTALFGVSETTQRRWERTVGMKLDKCYQMVHVPAAAQDAASGHIPDASDLDDDKRGPVFIIGGEMFYRWVNSYSGHYVGGCVGNTRKVGRAVRAAAASSCAGGKMRKRIIYPTKTWDSNTVQHKPGPCIWDTDEAREITHRIFSIKRFSTVRPVKRYSQEAL